MKRKILGLLVAFLFVPFMVFATESAPTPTTNTTTGNNTNNTTTTTQTVTCQSDKVTVEKIILKEKKGNAKETEFASVNNNIVKLNVEMGSVNDSITYEITVKNDANEDFEFDGKNLQINSDYISYTLKSSDNTNVVKKGTQKVFTLTVTYKAEVPTTALSGGSFVETKDIVYVVSDDLTPVNNNPKTGDSRGLFTIMCALIGFSFIYIILNKSKFGKTLAVLLIFAALPLTLYAVCKCEVKLDSKVTITPVETPPTPSGGGNEPDTPVEPENPNPGVAGILFNDPDVVQKLFGKVTIGKTKIRTITFVNTTSLTVPSDAVASFDLSSDESGKIIGYYKEPVTDKYDVYVVANGKIFFPENAKNLFYGLTKLTAINGLENVITSNTSTMERMFYQCSELTSLDLSHFDTSKVTNMAYMFGNVQKVTGLDLSSFDMSKVTNTSHMFDNAYKLTYILIKNESSANFALNTSNITLDTGMFSNCKELIGGVGTVYDENHIDKEYARLDSTTSPGYFTAKVETQICTGSQNPNYDFGEYRRSRYGSYPNDCRTRTGANIECGQNSTVQTSYHCTDQSNGSTTCTPCTDCASCGDVNNGYKCDTTVVTNKTCTSYSCPTYFYGCLTGGGAQL